MRERYVLPHVGVLDGDGVPSRQVSLRRHPVTPPRRSDSSAITSTCSRKIFLADDEDMLRTALVSLLDLEDSITVTGHGPTGQSALDHAPAEEIDVYVLDLEMPGLDGLDTARALLARDPQAMIVMITRHARPGILRSALSAGVRGFVPKNTPPRNSPGSSRASTPAPATSIPTSP